MDALTIQEAAEITDWSPRMLRYIERAGLIEPQRSDAGYRLYGPPELQRLRTLRELVTRFDIGLGEVGFAQRLRREDELAAAIDAWFRSRAEAPRARPGGRMAALGAGQALEAPGARRSASPRADAGRHDRLTRPRRSTHT